MAVRMLLYLFTYLFSHNFVHTLETAVHKNQKICEILKPVCLAGPTMYLHDFMHDIDAI